MCGTGNDRNGGVCCGCGARVAAGIVGVGIGNGVVGGVSCCMYVACMASVLCLVPVCVGCWVLGVEWRVLCYVCDVPVYATLRCVVVCRVVLRGVCNVCVCVHDTHCVCCECVV